MEVNPLSINSVMHASESRKSPNESSQETLSQIDSLRQFLYHSCTLIARRDPQPVKVELLMNFIWLSAQRIKNCEAEF